MNIEKLLKPGKVAIAGASESDSLGGKTTRYFLESYASHLEDVYFINPVRTEVYGRPCYATAAELPEEIDLIVIAAGKSKVMQILKDAATKKVKGAVVFASGYSETGKDEDREDELALKQFCEAYGIALMGPNCAGYINFVDGIYPFGFQFNKRKRAGKIGLVSQSGQVCTSMLLSPRSEFSYVISGGNSKIVQMEDYIRFLVEDKDTQVVAAYVEGFSDAEKLVEALKKAAEYHKPVVFLKSGRSARAAEVAASHTGSMTGADKNYDALFGKFGVIRADDIEQLSAICNILSLIPKLPGKNAVAVVCGSGGESAISADLCELHGISCPHFTAETVKRLKEILPDYASPNNPLDTTGGVIELAEPFRDALGAILEDEKIAMVVVGMPLYEQTRVDTETMVTAMEMAVKANPRVPMVAVPLIETGRNPGMVERLNAAGIPMLPPPCYAYPVLKKIIDYGQWRTTLPDRSLEIHVPAKEQGKRYALSEGESKKILKKYGITVPKEYVAQSPEEATEYAEKIGYPVVMKVESSDILHKSDAGAVLLGVSDKESVIRGYHKILYNCRNYKPEAKIGGILIQEMFPVGLEMIVGVQVDPQLGPMVLLGMGGIFVEIFKDVALYPAPVNEQEAELMIRSLKAYPLLAGYRGAKKLDVQALARTVAAMSTLAVENKDNLAELDINPLFVYEGGKGTAAADGLAVLKAVPDN